MHKGVWWGILKEIDVIYHGIREDNFKMGLKKSDIRL